ncbi:hypothetical protein VPHK406_0271 [Vibrio phage K406]
MTSHELARALLETNDAPISATVEIETGVFDKYGDEIIAHLECYSILELISNRFDPWSEVIENIIHFEFSGSRLDGIDVVKVVSEAAHKIKEK